VKTSIIQNLKKKHGNFFNGSSPDIYSGVVLGKLLSKHIFSNYPLTIHGLSHHSIGSSNVLKHIDANPFEKFWTENNIPFHEKLEKNSSLTIIYADAFLLARNYVPEIPEINIRDVIRLALNEPVTEKNRSNRDLLVESVIRIAEKNNMVEYAKDLISKTNGSFAPPSKIIYGFNPINEMVTLKTTDFGLKNIYDVFMLCKNMLHYRAYAFNKRPLNESVPDYFKRGFFSTVSKITG
jgi:hypothetical protein